MFNDSYAFGDGWFYPSIVLHYNLKQDFKIDTNKARSGSLVWT
jgi:hypothetical protein